MFTKLLDRQLSRSAKVIKPDLKQTLTMPKKSSARKKSSPASMHFTFEAVVEEDEKPVPGKVIFCFAFSIKGAMTSSKVRWLLCPCDASLQC